MKIKIYAVVLFFTLSLNITLAGGIEEDSKDYENVELTTREDISDFQELQEPLYEKLETILTNGCDGEGNVVQWSNGCVTWSGGFTSDDRFVRY
tara:strand:+ start:778 stop:1059 length:282 start_codon:yes stop_codon:yes gene_type:complete